MVAGEASGDLLAGLLLDGMRSRWPRLAAAGIGGPCMAARGFDRWWPSDRLAVRGYVEVLRHLPGLLRLRGEMARRLLADRPDAFIGVDAPDFNLRLEERLRAGGVKTIHFVSPSIWAWRAGRIGQIGRAVDHMLCVFPFEPAIYAKHGIAATFVGHPLAGAVPLEVPRAASRAALGLDREADAEVAVVALLPGSRRSEVAYIAPRLLAAAALLHRRRPALRFLLPAAPGLRETIEPLLHRHAAGVPIALLDGRSHEALAACDVTLVASGTATLEAALFKRPMVIVYDMPWLSWWLMNRQRLQPFIGLPNILLGEAVVPELEQQAASPEGIAREALAWLDDPARCAGVAARFAQLHLDLRRDTARLAADAIEATLA